MFTEISTQRLVTMAQVLPAGPFRLLALWLGLSKDGSETIYPTAKWCCAQLGISESTYHRWRRVLEGHNLVHIVRRKVAIRENLPNLVKVQKLRRASSWGWALMKATVLKFTRKLDRKGVMPDRQTPSPYISKPGYTSNRQREPYLQSEVYRRLMTAGIRKRGGETLG